MGFTVIFGNSVGLSLWFMNQVYPFHHAANCCFAWDFDAVKAIPHEACAAETQIYFSSDCIEFLKAYLLYGEKIMCNMTENLQVYDVQSLLTCFVRCCLKLADFLSVLKCLIHTYSAVISIFLVLIMNFPHSVSKRLILPWFTLTPKMIVKLLSADLQRIAVKTDFSGVSAVICPDCNIHQSLFFPDF
mgnify:CR=1 FL=1